LAFFGNDGKVTDSRTGLPVIFHTKRGISVGGEIKQRHHIKAMIFTGLFFVICISFIMWLKEQAARQPVPVSTATNDLKSTDWAKYGSDPYGDHFYRFDGSGKAFPDVFSVKTRLVYSEEGRNLYIAERQQARLPLQGFEKLDARTVLYGLNCFAKRPELCILEVFELTKEGTVLDYAKAGSYKNWKEIPPDSIHDKLYRVACQGRKEK